MPDMLRKAPMYSPRQTTSSAHFQSPGNAARRLTGLAAGLLISMGIFGISTHARAQAPLPGDEPKPSIVYRSIVNLPPSAAVAMAATAIAAPSFGIDWTNGLTGPGRYYSRQTVATDRLSAMACPQRTDSSCVKVVVKPGDVLYGGERSEVLGMTAADASKINEGPASGTKYFAISAYIPDDWVAPAVNSGGYQWGILMQLHGPDTLHASPSFAFNAENEFSINLRGGDTMDSRNYNKKYPFSNGTIPKNAWVDFVIGIGFASTATGSVTVWRHDQGSNKFINVLTLNNVATLQYASPEPVAEHYWKTGYYRSASPTTSTLYLGPQARGNTPAEAAAYAFKNVPELSGVDWNNMFP